MTSASDARALRWQEPAVLTLGPLAFAFGGATPTPEVYRVYETTEDFDLGSRAP